MDAQTAGDFGVFRVERLTMRDADDQPRRDFYTFACREWANVVAVTDEGDLVLVRQYRFGTDELSLEIPGGVVDDSETPIEAARRELLEETGYEAGEIVPLCSVQANPALQNNGCHTFFAKNAKKARETSFDADEECEVVLVPAKDVLELLDGNHVEHALCRLGLEVYARKFAAR